MERTVALKKLGQLLGKKLGYRINAKAPTPDARADARAALAPAIEERNKLKEQCDARFKALLEADAEYQSLKTAARNAIERVNELSFITCCHKITVGTSEGMFFLVKAEGDTWEEIIGKLTMKQVA